MSKTYNLGNKSDMKRFANDLAKTATDMAIKKSFQQTIRLSMPALWKAAKG